MFFLSSRTKQVWSGGCGRFSQFQAIFSSSSFFFFFLFFFRINLCVHYPVAVMLRRFRSEWRFCLFACFFGEDLRWTRLGRWWWMYVCFLWSVFDRQVLVIGCTLGGAFLLIHFRQQQQQQRWRTPFTSRAGGRGSGGLLFPSISQVQVQFVVFWRDYVCICILCV